MKTERLNIHIATKEETECFISKQKNEMLKIAYGEMLSCAINHPDMWDFYAIWMIEFFDGTHIGELCFK